MQKLLAIHALAAAFAAVGFAASAAAQSLDVVFVTDSTGDNVWRLEDLDGDGTYDGVGETVEFYSDTLGTIALSNNIGITRDAATGIVYVCDSSVDIILALEDLDGDGNCNDVGEHRVFFDGNAGGNASGVLMVSAQDLFVAPDGKLWVASANTASGNDLIFYLEDLNGDGDANDAGEAVIYYQIPGLSTGDSLPQDVTLGPDGAMYYLESGSTGFFAKGIYRLEDLDSNGSIDPSEATAFFIPPALGSSAFYWGFDVDDDGAFYLADTGNDVIWRVRDANGNGTIEPAETTQWWTSPGPSTIWSVSVGNDGWLYAGEFVAPSRVFRMRDTNQNGVIDLATEFETVYDENLAGAVIGNPRSIHVARDLGSSGVAYCFGDGSGLLCPCGNSGGVGEGCANSTGSGAVLSGAGSTSVSSGGLVLTVTGALPGQPGLVFAGVNAITIPFGDGLRCAGGNLRRFPVTLANAQGSYSARNIATTLNVVGGDVRRFQGWYRNPVNSPCGTTFNLTNGFEVLFTQ